MKRKYFYFALGVVMAGAGIFYGCSKSSNSPSPGGNNNGNHNNGNTVAIQNFAFVPDTLRVQAGTTVTWTNDDSATHTVTSLDGLFDSGNVAASATYKYTFGTAGTFAYHCTIHSMMKTAVVIVSQSSGNGY